MTRALGPGDVLMGRYRILSLLGSGGMGSVWRAEHLHLQTQVAVKLLDPRIADDEQILGRFLLEARAAATLRNRHVVQIFDYGVEEGNAFIVMEMLHGETLGARIERLGRIPVDETVRFMCQVMRAIAPAHDAGIIHRDLKPDNIFITSDEEGEYAKVLDFGVAKVQSGSLSDAGVKTQTGVMVGTPYYMSPEQAKAKPIDRRSDVWALAVITYECVTGQRPFGGDSFGDLVLNICTQPVPLPSKSAVVPAGFDEWFVRGTQRDVTKRFPSTREMAQELLEIAAAPLVGRRTSDGTELAKGPAGTVVGPGPQPAGGASAAPPRGAPAKERGGEGARRLRLHLTTGQRAATGYDADHPGRSRVSWGLLATLGIAAAVLVGAGVTYAVRLKGNGGGAELTGSAAAPSVEAALDGPEPSPAAAAPGSPPPRLDAAAPAAATPEAPGSTPASPALDAAGPAKAAAVPAGSPQRPDTSLTPSGASQAAAPQVAASKPPPRDPAPAPTADPKRESTQVPVVDRNALPPKDWEF
jgi:serine/threonine-protein kinase